MTDAVPLKAPQRPFWIGQRLAGDAPLYNMAWRYDLRFDLDPAVFAKAFQAAVTDSDIMRACFVERDGAPSQTVGPVPPLPTVVDLSEGEVPAYMDGLIQEPFDLGQGTYRTRLIRLGSQHWVWIFVQHHIATDAQAGANFFDLVSSHYRALTHSDAPRPTAPSPYFEADFPTPAAQPTAGGVVSRPYGVKLGDDPTSVRVQVPLTGGELADAAGQKPFQMITPALSKAALILALYAAFLARLTRDETVHIDLPIHGRNDRAAQGALGPFLGVSALGLSTHLDQAFAAFHSQVAKRLLKFLRSGGQSPSGASKTGLAALNIIQAQTPDFAGHPVRAEWVHPGAHDPHHALRLHLSDFSGSGEEVLHLDVNAALLCVHSAEEIAAQFATFAQAVLADPTQPLDHYPLSRHLVEEPVTPSGLGPTVLDQFRSVVGQDPDRIALVSGSDRVSFAALDQRSGRFAGQLRSHGAQPGDPIVLHMGRSVEYVVAVLGCLKAGCQFIPIALSNPMDRCEKIVAASGAKLIVLDTGQDWPEGAAQAIHVVDTVVPADDLAPVPADCLAYTIYTSGSTGTPKGVEVEHRALADYIQWAAQAFGGTSYAFCTSISFDLTITSLFVPLTKGGTLHVYPEPAAGPDLAVLDAVADDRVEVIKLTPAHLALVAQQGTRASQLKSLVLGGENLSVGLCNQAQAVLGDIAIHNEYGPTEGVVGCMIHSFDARHDLGSSVPIGRPAPGVGITLRDPVGNLVPTGVVGEIHITGRLARGYAAGADPSGSGFLTTHPKRYATGDLGRYRPDGVLEYLGRADRQFKIGGVRIEAAEIEAAGLKIDGVKDIYVGLPIPGQTPARCVTCGIGSDVPDVTISDAGFCNICTDFDAYSDRAHAYFGTEDELRTLIDGPAGQGDRPYTAIMLLSGGKDSTYAAYQLARFTDRVLALTLDNGFLSEEAIENTKRVARHLNWDHEFLTTPHMNDVFVDSLRRHSNVCNGCFKTLYTLALERAVDRDVPLIVTGLSRGQLFETRLPFDLFRHHEPTRTDLDRMVQDARRRYHAEDDLIAAKIAPKVVKDGRALDQVTFVDIYRYLDVSVSEIYRFLDTQSDWVRPYDTGRSTNCKINDLGIFLHQKREGYHNYAIPYSWDVRLGHKTVTQAQAELDDTLDTDHMRAMMDDIGFHDPVEASAVTAYVVSDRAEGDVRQAFERYLPREMVPNRVVTLDALPLTSNGKVDTTRLPRVARQTAGREVTYRAPTTKTEEQLAQIFAAVLRIQPIGIDANFFDLGGDSLSAIQIAIRANEAGLPLGTTALFEFPTIAQLASSVDGAAAPTPEATDTALIELDDDDMAAILSAIQ